MFVLLSVFIRLQEKSVVAVRTATVQQLEKAIDALVVQPRAHVRTLPTGFEHLDALLPQGGLPRGRATEWVGPRSCGKTALLRTVLGRLTAMGEPVAYVDGGWTLFAPDWVELAERGFWVVRPGDTGEAAWSADLLLRSGAFGAVVLDPGGSGTGSAASGAPGLRRSVAVRLQRLAEEAESVFVVMDEMPIAALRLRFRPGRIEPVGGPLFGHLLPPVRSLWVGVETRGMIEVPVLCPLPLPRREVRPSRDRKGPE
jgi:RecA/RadA recombinase